MLPPETLADVFAFLQLNDIGPVAHSTRQLSELALAHGKRIIWRFSVLRITARSGRPDVIATFVSNETEQIRFPKVTASDILDIALRNCVFDEFINICDCRGDPVECFGARSLQAVRTAAVVSRIHFHLCCFSDSVNFMEALEHFGQRKLTVSFMVLS